MGIAVMTSAIKCLRQTWLNFFLPLLFVPFLLGHLAWTGLAVYQFYLTGNYDARDHLFSFSNEVIG